MSASGPLRLWKLVPLLAVTYLCLATSTAWAHALLLQSEPNQGAILNRQPPVIHLWFSEDLNGSLSRAVVWDRNRRQVDLKDDRVTHARELTVTLRPHLKDGSYLVLWTSVSSQDGHVLRGAYVFSIGHRGPVPAASSASGSSSFDFPPSLIQSVQILARTLELASAAFWLGLTIFLVFVLPAPKNSRSESLTPAATMRAAIWLPIALSTLLAARSLGLIIQANALAGGDWASTFNATTFNGLLLQTEYGHLWIGTQALALLALAVTLAATRVRQATRTRENRERSSSSSALGVMLSLPRYAINGLSAAAFLLVLAALESYLVAASGHAATVNVAGTGTGIFTIPVAVDWVHLLASGVWAGGIFTVASVVVPALTGSNRTPIEGFLDTLDRFSPFAYAGVLLLVATGPFNGVVHIPSWQAFFNAVYGRALLAKIALVFLMILMSAFTVGVVRPRLRRLLAASLDQSEGSIGFLLAVLLRWLRVGAVLGVGVFLATAVMNSYPVPITFGAPKGPFAISGRTGTIGVALKLNPGKAGPNRFTVTVRDRGNLIPRGDVRIIQTMLDMNMGTQYVVLSKVSPGVFRGSGQVAMGGHWQFEVLVRLPGRSRIATVRLRSLVAD